MPLGVVLSMPSAHVARFKAAYDIEPFGERRADYRHAEVLHALACLGGEKRPLPHKHYLTDWWKPRPTPEEEEARLIARLDAAFGADGWEGGDGGR